MKRQKIVAVYHGDDAQAILDTFGKAWCRGDDVVVQCGVIERPFFEFALLARSNDDEPASWIARYILTRRGLKLSYRGGAARLAHIMEEYLGLTREATRERVHLALSRLASDGAWR